MVLIVVAGGNELDSVTCMAGNARDEIGGRDALDDSCINNEESFCVL